MVGIQLPSIKIGVKGKIETEYSLLCTEQRCVFIVGDEQGSGVG